MTRLARVAVVGLSVMFASTSVQAAIQYMGPMVGPGGMSGWMGTDVWYLGVSESNAQGPGGTDAMLFGAPTGVFGNSIDFSPTAFGAQVTAPAGGFASEIVDGQLSFMVVAKQGSVIDNLQLLEAGDTTITALSSSIDTNSSVTTAIFIDVVEIDGVPVGAPVNLTGSMVFTPSGGSYNNSQDGGQPYDTNGAGTIFSALWSGVANIDFPTELATLGVPFRDGVTKINVTLDNTLSVTAVNGESAFIKKKDFDGIIITTNVPEPTTLALLALAGAGALMGRRC